MNEALIVKLGLDRAGFENGLRAAVQDAEKAGQQLKAGSLASAQAMADSHGIAIASSGKLKHALRDVTSEILSGGSATDVFTASALKLAGVMKIGLGAAAGLAVGGVIIKQVMEINDAADELRKHIGRIGQPINGADYSSLDGLKTRLDEIRKTSGELKTEMGGGFLSQMAQIAGGAGWKGAGMIAASAVLGPVYAAVGTGLAAHKGAHNVADRRDSEQGTLEKAQQDVLDKIAAKQKSVADIEEARITKGERIAQLAKLDAEFTEQKGKLLGITDGVDKSGEIEQLTRTHELQKQVITDKLDAADRAHALEAEILSIQKDGEDVAERTAYARTMAAEKELELAKNPDTKAAAANALEAAMQELESAIKTTAEHKQQLALQTAIASMISDEDTKHAAALKGEREALTARLTDPKTKPDERAEIGAGLAKNLDQQRQFDKGQAMKGFALADSAIDSNTGQGQGEHIKATGDHLGVAKQRAAYLAANPIADPQEIAQAAGAVEKLTQELTRLVEERQKAVNDANDELTIMQQQLAHHDQIAEKLSIEKGFREKILQAEKDGNSELAKTLKAQQAIATAQSTKTTNAAGKGQHFEADPADTPQDQNKKRLAWLKNKAAEGRAARKDAHDKLNAGKAKGGPDADVGNQAPSFMPDHTPNFYPGKPMADAPGIGAPLTKADLSSALDASLGSFVAKIVAGISPLGEDV